MTDRRDDLLGRFVLTELLSKDNMREMRVEELWKVSLGEKAP